MADPMIPSYDFDSSDSEEESFEEHGAESLQMHMIPSALHGMGRRQIRDFSRVVSAAMEFIQLNSEIRTDRDLLIQTFPLEVEFPEVGLNSKLEWCIFCLGSRLCARIYNEGYEEPVREIAGHSPALSLVVHLDQDALFMLLKHFHEWFLSIGLEESLAGWVFAVVACLPLPLAKGTEALIKTLYQDFEERLKFCNDESERINLYRMSTILDVEFLNY